MNRHVLLSLGLAMPLLLPVAAPAQPESAPPAAPAGGVLAREPQTPLEMFDAAVKLLRLSRPELARQYLAGLLATEPDDATLFAIREQHGTATFVQLSRLEELQPESTILLERLNTAARNQLEDPAFQESLLQGLNGTPRQREASLGTLHALGDDAAPLLIGRIAAGVPPEEEVQLMQALLRLAPGSIPPLQAALESPHDHVRTVAANLLGRLEAGSAALELAAVAFNPTSPPSLSETARGALARIQFGGPEHANQVTSLRLTERLQAQARLCLRRELPLETGPDGLTRLWHWSESAGTVQLSHVSPRSAQLAIGERSSRAALEIAPADAEAQALLLAHLMWRDVLAAGWDQPLPTGAGTAHDLALTLSPAVVERTLKVALETSNAAATVVALRVLAQTGSRSTLLSAGSPLLAAVDSPEPRVQFAAVEAVLQLDPEQPFPGAARIVEILARALNAEHLPKSVVIDPNIDRGAGIAGLISTLGFASSLAETGQRGFNLASHGGDVELAVLHLNTIQWELSQTVANLRADPRTKHIPIAVYGPPELRRATYQKLRPYRPVAYLDELADPGTIRAQLAPLLEARSVPELTEEQRQARVASAAFWFRHIAEGCRSRVFSLEPAAPALLSSADRAGVARDVLIALGAIGKPAVQQRMAEVALASGLSVETRRAAAVQLAFHIQRYGRMLDNTSARRVAEVYQQEQSPELQSVLAAVVGALQPDAAAATSLLLDHPGPESPLP